MEDLAALYKAVLDSTGEVVVFALDLQYRYLVFNNSAKLLARLGRIGALVVTRLMAFILLCIGIQIIWTGWAGLNGLDT